MLAGQPDEGFGGRLAQVNRCAVGKAVVGGDGEAQPFLGQDQRFQAIVGGWHRRDDHDIQGTTPQLVEDRRHPSLLEGERDIGVCGQKRIEQPGYVAGAAAVAEAQRDAAPVGIDDLLEVLSGSAQVDQRLLCRGQERPPSLGRGDSTPARLHQRGADRVGEAMHDGADGRLRHPQPFCRAPHVLLLQDRHGDDELRTDDSQPFNIWIKHIRKPIGLINAGCGIVTLTDRTQARKETTMTTDTNNSVKAMLQNKQFITAPGVFDLVSAKIADRTTAQALYMTGYGVVASYLGQPDAGLATYTDMVNRAEAIVDAIHKPLIADGDTGYGGLLNVAHTVRGYEKAGVAVIQIEDQHFPKKCGHTPNRHVVPTQEMVNKIKVASDARSSADFLILARTDALTSLGLDEALRRGEAYAKAGADILFIEAPESKEQMRKIGAAFDVPVLSNQLHGGVTPILPPSELQQMGFAAAIYPTVGLFAASHALASVYQALAQGKPVSEPVVCLR